MPPSTPRPVNELLLEYQHYLMAYRLRQLLGEALRPATLQLTLGQYGLARNERQSLARQMISRSCPPGTLTRLDTLTDTLMFGFWHNPAQVADFIRAAIRQGGHPALEQPDIFITLLSSAERGRLGPVGVQRVVRHYYACLALAALYTSPHGFDEAWSKIEAEPVPLFADELKAAGRLTQEEF
ncbi:hypothetical protein [Deinococcus detaillensis]|uniref:hypothetical protein n=1 Tax=Deinococcus detaillensis TaxID=2592048 RepID=UPI001CDC40C3|nr:hypothetical protein [Deinococcus detaillensis]